MLNTASGLGRSIGKVPAALRAPSMVKLMWSSTVIAAVHPGSAYNNGLPAYMPVSSGLNGGRVAKVIA